MLVKCALQNPLQYPKGASDWAFGIGVCQTCIAQNVAAANNYRPPSLLFLISDPEGPKQFRAQGAGPTPSAPRICSGALCLSLQMPAPCRDCSSSMLMATSSERQTLFCPLLGFSLHVGGRGCVGVWVWVSGSKADVLEDELSSPWGVCSGFNYLIGSLWYPEVRRVSTKAPTNLICHKSLKVLSAGGTQNKLITLSHQPTGIFSPNFTI